MHVRRRRLTSACADPLVNLSTRAQVAAKHDAEVRLARAGLLILMG